MTLFQLIIFILLIYFGWKQRNSLKNFINPLKDFVTPFYGIFKEASLKEKMISILILILVIWFFVSYESEEWEGFCYELSNGKTQCYSEKQFEDMVDDASNKKY